MRYLLPIVLFFTSIIVILYYLLSTLKNDYNNITFLTKSEVSKFFSSDNDAYVAKLSQADLHARKVKSNEEYKSIIQKCSRDFCTKRKKKNTNMLRKRRYFPQRLCISRYVM